ncbi:MAG: VanZ family protein [Clostridia bacterium]|nr:VanZ family protein [Clostridia bacterium]
MKKSRIFLILAVLVTVFIFSNSAQNADTSAQISNGLFAFLSQLLSGFENIITPKLLRKAAHFTEFFAQAVFLSLSAQYSKKGLRPHLVQVAFAGLLTACCDELLQTFSAGRSPQVTDIFIDFSGCAAAMVIVMLCFRRRNKNVRF